MSDYITFDTYDVSLRASVYDGRYYGYGYIDYRVYKGYVGVETHTDAVNWIVNNKQQVIGELSIRRYHPYTNGRKGRLMVQPDAADHIKFPTAMPIVHDRWTTHSPLKRTSNMLEHYYKLIAQTPAITRMDVIKYHE